MPDGRCRDGAPIIERSTREVKRYARRRYALFVAHILVGVVFLAFMAAWGSPVVAEEARKISGPDEFLLTVFCYFVGFSFAYTVFTLPLAFYGGYVLERQFGLSTQRASRWLGRRLKKWGLSFVIVAPLVVAFYWMLRRWPQTWWLPAAAVWILFSWVLAKFAPRFLIPLFYKLERVRDDALAARLLALAAKAGVRLTGAFRIDLSRETRKANAAVVGLGATRRILLGDTLLSSFTPDEIEVVFAHELGHIVHRDLAKGFLLASALIITSLYAASRVLAAAAGALGIPHVYDPETMPILVTVLGTIQLLVMPFEKWYSRRRELASDAYALRTTGNRAAFIAAMKKLGAMNLADVNPNRLAEVLLFDHPSIRRRIRFAEQFRLDDAKQPGGATG